jgi:hypothetical protein
VQIRSLAELTAVDELTQRFMPGGFGLDRVLSPESAAEFHQSTIADADLVDEVPDDVRTAYEDVRECHIYGVLSYRFFGLAVRSSYFVLETALRRRFLDFYNEQVPLENKACQTRTFATRAFDDLHEEFRSGGSLSKQGWQLKLKVSGERVQMPLTLAPLLRWARSERLLDGQAGRIQERLIPTGRNWAAHGEMRGGDMPNLSARQINDLAEIVNRLWGARTAGGRLYPAPLERQIVALTSGTADGQRHWAVMAPSQIPIHLADVGDDAVWLLVHAVAEDENLIDFNSHYERTTYPADLVWGPGDGESAHVWWTENQPTTEPIDHLDRLFLVQIVDGTVYLPRRVDIAFGLPPGKRSGVWHAIRADNPNHAFLHGRNIRDGACKPGAGARCGCAAEGVASGSWREIKNALAPYDVFAPSGEQVSLPLHLPLPATVGHD